MNEFEKELNFVKKIYKDIIYEYSTIQLNNQDIYIKHLTDLDLANIHEKYSSHLEEAKKKGLLEEQQKLDLLDEKNIWKKSKEEEIKKIKDEINLNNDTKRKLLINSQIEQINSKNKELEKKLLDIEKERSEVIGMTAEDYALRKANEYLIYLSFCKNKDFCPYFESEEDFFNLEIEELTKYAYLYQKYLSIFSLSNLKKLAVSNFFMNIFFLSENNPFTFFGKSISKLTHHQVNLFTLARTYKYTLERTGEVPPNSLNSLQELVDWYEGKNLNISNKIKEDNKEFTGKTYVGATKEEIKKMISPKDEIVDLEQESKKHGGNLSFDQILKIHGVK